MLVSAAWQANFTYLINPHPDDRMEYSGAREINGEEFVGLTMEPVGGVPMTVWFDPQTWYIRHVGMRMLGREMLTEFTDIQLVDGWLPVAMSSTMDTGFMKLELKTTFLELNPDVDPAMFSPPEVLAGDVTFPDASDSVTLPLLIDGGHVFVKAEVGGGKELSFLIDTGAESNFIHSRIAEELGIEGEGILEAVGYGGSAGISFIRVPSLKLGGVVIEDQTWASYDLSQLRRGIPHLDGILGYDFIANFVIDIDYSGSTVTLHKPGTWNPDEGSNRIPLGFFKKVPTTQGMLDGMQGTFMLDTGSSNFLDLTRSYAEAHSILGDSEERALTMRGMGGDTRITLRDMDMLRLGDLEFENPTVGILLGNTGGLASIEEIDGNIGSQLFMSYGRAVFDYGDRSLYLIP
jgi:predicted aspartyl protease